MESSANTLRDDVKIVSICNSFAIYICTTGEVSVDMIQGVFCTIYPRFLERRFDFRHSPHDIKRIVSSMTRPK